MSDEEETGGQGAKDDRRRPGVGAPADVCGLGQPVGMKDSSAPKAPAAERDADRDQDGRGCEPPCGGDDGHYAGCPTRMHLPRMPWQSLRVDARTLLCDPSDTGTYAGDPVK
jgi:hypothetical protein